MNYQWYPGHMTKAVRQLEEQIRLIDLVIEIVDARIPASGRNRDLDRLAGGRARMILFAKCDLADPAVTKEWMKAYKAAGLHPYEADLRNRSALKDLTPQIREVCHEKIERDRRRGIANRPVRAMVAGIPNVGKSTFINSFSGSASLKTGNRPGVTKGKQWIRINREVELLDTPGLLMPKFEDQEIGKRVAYVGSMPDDILDVRELSVELINDLGALYPGAVGRRYGIEETDDGNRMLDLIGRARGCLRSGGAVDEEKAARVFLDDFRSGRLGRISLERP